MAAFCGPGPEPAPRAAAAQVVEELMSIADGQVVLQRSSTDAAAPVGVDARVSVSRIGSRAYPPALAGLAASIRLQLAQARHAAAVACTTPPGPAHASAPPGLPQLAPLALCSSHRATCTVWELEDAEMS